MTKQLSLFPDSPLNKLKRMPDGMLTDLEAALNPVDEVFAASSRFRDCRNLMELLSFIARFPNYSAFNGLLLYAQNSSATYVATARHWMQKFNRKPKYTARPLAILAPMAPIRFVFDIQDTEGAPVPSRLLEFGTTRNQLSASVYTHTCLNSATQGIAVYETALDPHAEDSAGRITPALRKQYRSFDLSKDTSYLVLIEKAKPLEDKYGSLVHELGHIFCGHLGIDRHAWWPEREDLDVMGEEIEADCVAYLICARLGLKALAANYLSSHIDQSQQLPVFSLNAVLQAVTCVEEMGKSRWKGPRKRRRQ
jgi:hypothetical protein